MNKSVKIWTKLSKDETQVLDRTAKKAGMTRSAFVRFCIESCAKQDIPVDDYDPLLEKGIMVWSRVTPETTKQIDTSDTTLLRNCILSALDI